MAILTIYLEAPSTGDQASYLHLSIVSALPALPIIHNNVFNNIYTYPIIHVSQSQSHFMNVFILSTYDLSCETPIVICSVRDFCL